MFELVPGRPDLVAGEHEILKLWEEARTFEKLRAKNAGKPPWSFLDGPITANGFMGVHHAWGRTLKDAFQRYFAMTGHDERWQNGFDCQGLWVEVQVERDLGFKSKRDIEEYGIEEFVQRCKERVWKYSAIQTQQSIRLGMWMDWPNSYFTMSDENNYTIWSFLKKCHQRGYLYKGLDAMPWCPRCGTGISEQERKEGYKLVEDDAVYVKFPLLGRDREYLLVWTTTPWTLAANVAAAVNPNLMYTRIQHGGEVYYVAKNRASAIGRPGPGLGGDRMPGSASVDIVLPAGSEDDSAEFGSEGDDTEAPELKAEEQKEPETEPDHLSTSGPGPDDIKGREMVGWEYEGPFDEFPAAGPAVAAHRVIAWEDVSEAEGTGIVHIAPGCGKEDFDLGRDQDLPLIAPIDDSGIYVEGFGHLTGKPALEVNDDIFRTLNEKLLLYKRERYRHDYPHCWRCATPLLFRSVDEWYIDMSWRKEIKQIVKQIRWIPDYGEELELDWLKNMGDWMISKKRYWGLALPIYECRDCGWFDVVGGREELRARAAEGWDEFVGDPAQPNTPHRPWIDAVKIACGNCEGLASRIPDVGNPWLDAGIVPYSTTAYNTDKQYWSKWIPADFVVESFPGQFRNWFYALLTMSTMMEGIPPFKTLLGYASVRDDKGEEMHYSKGNAIEFDAAADRMGADVMRWMYCRQNPTQNMNFGYGAGEQVERKVFGTLWNSYLFFVNYARLDKFDPAGEPIPPAARPEIDRWILSDLQALISAGRTSFENYLIAPFIRHAEDFIDQLSNWYIRRNRQRFWDPRGKNEQDKLAAYQTLHEVLVTLCQLLAPVIPFLAERMYQNLVVKGNASERSPESVHLCDFPPVKADLADEALSFRMAVVQDVCGAARSLREQQQLRVRQPLAEMRIGSASSKHREALERLSSLVMDELNVKDLTVTESLEGLTELRAKPNFASLGPKFGKQARAVAGIIGSLSPGELKRLQQGEAVEIPQQATLEEATEIGPEDVILHVDTRPGWAAGEAGPIQIAIDIRITPELEKEGLARDVVRHIQQLRRDVGLNIEDRIDCYFETDDPTLKEAINEWRDYIAGETQAENLVEGSMGLNQEEVDLGGRKLLLEVVLKTTA